MLIRKIQRTADVHELAWVVLFADFEFTRADCFTYVDGRPRYDGVRAFGDRNTVGGRICPVAAYSASAMTRQLSEVRE